MSKKEDLKLELRSLIDAAEKAGSFSDEAKARRDEIKKELENLADLEQTRALMESVEVAEKTPVSKPKEVEIRSIETGYDNGAKTKEEFEARAWCKVTLGSHDLTESEKVYQRSVDITNDGNVIPTLIKDEINDKITRTSDVVALARHFNSPSQFNIFDQTTVNAAAVRADDVTDASGSVTDSAISAISFTPKYITNEVVISNALVRQSGANLQKFLVDELSMRLGEKLESQILTGSGASGQLTGLNKTSLTIAGQSALTSTQATLSAITEGDIRSLYNTLPTAVARRAHAGGSLRFVMSSTTYNTMVSSLVEKANDVWADSSAGTEASELKVSGNILKLHRDLTQQPAKTLFGVPVIINDSLAALSTASGRSILLVDFARLGINTFKAPSLDRVVDATLARKGQSLFLMHADYDSQMLDHRAMVQFVNAAS